MPIKKIVRTSPDPILVAERFDQAQGALAKIAHINWLIDQINAEDSHNKITTFITLTDAPDIAWDYSLSSNAQVTLGGNRTLAAPTNVVSGDYGTLKVIQDATGNRTLGFIGTANFKVVNGGAGAVTLSTAAGAVDFISWVYDGTDFNVTLGKEFN